MEIETQKLKSKVTNKVIVIILFVISFLPLPIYPFILLGNIMSLAGHRDGNENLLLLIVAMSFLIFSALYPFTFLYSLINIKKWNVIISALPLFHLIISIILFVIWSFFDV